MRRHPARSPRPPRRPSSELLQGGRRFRTQPVYAGLLGELASSVPDPGIADGLVDGVRTAPAGRRPRSAARRRMAGWSRSSRCTPAVHWAWAQRACRTRGGPGRRPGARGGRPDRVPDGDPGAVGSLHRQQIHRRERNLARSHRVRFRLHQPRSGSASRKLQSRRAFHYEFASVALERGSLGPRPLELDDRPVAVWYGIRSVGVDTCYQSARTSAWSERRSGWCCSPTASGSPPGRRLGVPLRPRRRGVPVPAGRGRTIEGGSPRSQEG
jgi:hypothetical protein